MVWPSWIPDWFDVPFIRYVFRHVSGTIVTITLFAATAWFLKEFPLGVSRNLIEGIEHFVVVTLFIILAIELLISVIKEVWKQLRGGWNGTQVFAV